MQPPENLRYLYDLWPSYLQQIYVSIHHGVAEVTLDVGQSLTFNLETVTHPHATENLMEHHLEFVTKVDYINS